MTFLSSLIRKMSRRGASTSAPVAEPDATVTVPDEPQNADVDVPVQETVVNDDDHDVEKVDNINAEADAGVDSASTSSSGLKTKVYSKSNLSKQDDPEDASTKAPAFFDYELDENSEAGKSAATLKKAIQQAQKTLNIARKMMERKKQERLRGYDSKSRANGYCLEIKENDKTMDGNLGDIFYECSMLEEEMEMECSHDVITNVKAALEQTSAQGCEENAKEMASNTKDVAQDDLDFSSEKREVSEKDAKANEKSEQEQRIEAIRRGREREKERIAAQRAISEAREQERIAVQRAMSEARERAFADAQERAFKLAKLREEKAEAERLAEEARERARDNAVVFPRDITRLSRNFSYSDSSKVDRDNDTESAERRKARLERQQRIMDRAAKALAEKNMRDLLVEKEQAERNRISLFIDADIKRWATGKEGNLRALLSTLHYILGRDSGWEAIPLTEMITSAAIKSAYKKAILYLHPDKLQQRGANVREKYMCEKVFFLLKDAWSSFNS